MNNIQIKKDIDFIAKVYNLGKITSSTTKKTDIRTDDKLFFLTTFQTINGLFKYFHR